MEPFIGQIMLFGGNFAPRGWALCDGQLLPISQYTALFSILGTTYGGDGESTFGLPDLRGRVAVHEGDGPGLDPKSLGEKGGQNEVSLTANNLPSHTHSTVVTHSLTLNATPASAQEEEAGDNALATAEIYADAAPTEALRAGSVGGTVNVTLANSGNNVPFGNEQPYQVLNYIIALVGTYPSRS